MRTTVLVGILLTILASAQEPNPSLEETLQWVQQTLVQHGSYVEHYQYKNLRTRHDTSRLARYDSCHVTLAIDSEGGIAGPGTLDSATADFDLKDLDPSAIVIEPRQRMRVAILVDGKGPYDEAFVKISTRNSASAIHRVYTLFWGPEDRKMNHEEKASTTDREDVPVLEIGVDNPDYAVRLSKAFKHAAELCGGKPSAF